MNETFWEKVYDKAEYKRLFIQLLRKTVPMYAEMLNMLK